MFFCFFGFLVSKKNYEMSGFLCFTFLPIEISRILINTLDIYFILSRNFQSSRHPKNAGMPKTTNSALFYLLDMPCHRQSWVAFNVGEKYV